MNDYYEARLLVGKCVRQVAEHKARCCSSSSAQMRACWTFEAYSIESHGQCGDQQRCKHVLNSEKALLNRTELAKLQAMLAELRVDLVRGGLVSSQFCSKMARQKLESYMQQFVERFRHASRQETPTHDAYALINAELRQLVDILFYFDRKHAKVSRSSSAAAAAQSSNPLSSATIAESASSDAEQDRDGGGGAKKPTDGDTDDTDLDQPDDVFKSDVLEWLRYFATLLLDESERRRRAALVRCSPPLPPPQLVAATAAFHFDNVFYLLQHLLRSPQLHAISLATCLHVPLLFDPTTTTSTSTPQTHVDALALHSSSSDALVHLYFDSYLKIVAAFAYDVKMRWQFLNGVTSAASSAEWLKSKASASYNKQQQQQQQVSNAVADQPWQFIDLEGDVENADGLLVEMAEDDLIKLYAQLPFRAIFAFLWSYLEHQTTPSSAATSSSGGSGAGGGGPDYQESFRKRYVAMKVQFIFSNM